MEILKNSENELVIFSKAELKNSAEYWSEDRIKNAKPKDIVINLPPNFKPSKIDTVGTVTRADVTQYPFKLCGKLFFSDSNGNDYFASAQFCGDNAIILTAAHCVFDYENGNYYENFMFKEAYNNGGGNKHPIRAVCIKTDWRSKHNYGFDYSLMITDSKESQNLSYALKFPTEKIMAIGYPSNYDNAKRMQKVDGTKGYIKNNIVQMLNNPMYKGCSGGAWFDEKNNIVGLNSFSYVGEDNTEYGPYFDDNFESLFQFTKKYIYKECSKWQK